MDTITGRRAVLAALDTPVPEVSGAATGVAWLRSHVARFSNGEDHRRRRALAVAALARVDPSGLRRRATEPGGHPVDLLAAALDVPARVEDVVAVAGCYQPHLPVTPAADEAVGRLVDACGGVADEGAAALIGLLVQACDATATLIHTAHQRGLSPRDVLRDDPPVRFTRRGDALVDLASAGLPFGAGPHACPGRDHALALAEARPRGDRGR